jgi:hypothetical protein
MTDKIFVTVKGTSAMPLNAFERKHAEVGKYLL